MEQCALNIALSLFKRWNSEGIKYCHWKSNEHLLDGLAGKTDLDVLVEMEQRAEAENILRSLGYIKMISQFGFLYSFVDDWIGCDREQGRLIHIHLYYEVISGHMGLKEYTLPFKQMLLDSRILDNRYSIFISSPELEIVILYTRVGIKADYADIFSAKMGKYHLPENDLQEIIYLKRKSNWDKIKVIVKEYYGSMSDKMFHLMKQDLYDSKWILELHWIAIKTFKKDMRTSKLTPLLKIFYKFSVYGRLGLRKYIMPNLIIRKTFGKKKGVVIAIIGQDGAGKSTISNEIKEWLSWKVDVKKAYLGSGEHYHSWQKKVINLLERSDHVVLRGIRFNAALSNLSSLARHTYKTVLKARKFADKGGVVILDRFPQIQYEGINDGPKICMMLKKTSNQVLKTYIQSYALLEEKYLKKAVKIMPDLIVKLILPVEISLKRKPEENASVVRRKHDIVEKLKFEGSTCICVDATMPYEDEIIKIHNSIWDLLLEKQTCIVKRKEGLYGSF